MIAHRATASVCPLVAGIAVAGGGGGRGAGGDGVVVVVVEQPSAATPATALTEDVGLETLGGVFTPVLSAGCALPCSRTESFSTAVDGQLHIDIRPYRGRGVASVADATSLGTFRIGDVPVAPRGEPMIPVTFLATSAGLSLSVGPTPTGQPVTLARVVGE